MTTWFQSPAGWYVLGFTGQLVFASRFVIQWWASERQRRVIVPGLFWYLSLVGGAALLLYAWHKRDPVFAVGQLSGILIYVRNLMLHGAEKGR